MSVDKRLGLPCGAFETTVRMEDCIDSVGPATFVTKLDLLKGYWQVPLTPRASEISAFVTPDHFLQYTVMPFGVRNAPATFQRLMNLVLGNFRNCSVYLDDVVVYSSDWASHIASLTTVFERLVEASLTLNLAKCEFGKAMVTYLGKQVGHGQVRPVDAKILAVLSYPVPMSRPELQHFLGMAGYYRCFCKNFCGSSSVNKSVALGCLLCEVLSVNMPLRQQSLSSAVHLSWRHLTSFVLLNFRSWCCADTGRGG